MRESPDIGHLIELIHDANEYIYDKAQKCSYNYDSDMNKLSLNLFGKKIIIILYSDYKEKQGMILCRSQILSTISFLETFIKEMENSDE